MFSTMKMAVSKMTTEEETGPTRWKSGGHRHRRIVTCGSVLGTFSYDIWITIELALHAATIPTN